MPGKQERGINLEELNEIIMATPPSVCYIEWNTARPGEVPDRAFLFGLQTGQLDALFFARGHDVRHVSPRTWKADLGLPGKEADPESVQGMALFNEAYPGNERLITGPRGGTLDGPLDALLLAHWGRNVHKSAVGRKGAGRRPPRFVGFTKDEV
jgi:hypothetical protein